MRVKCLISLLMFFALISCKSGNDSSQKNDFTRIDVRKLIESPARSLPLSEHFNEVRYVILETSEEVLLHGVAKVLIHGDYIFVSDHRHVYQYHQDGKFIQKIGKSGNGPGEYIGMIRFALDPVHNELLIYSTRTHKLNVYNLVNGAFLYEKEFPFYLSDFAHLNDGSCVLFTREFNKSLGRFTANEAYLLNSKRDIQDSISNAARYSIEIYSMGYASLFSLDKGLYYLYNYKDTLYYIDHAFQRTPKAKFELDNQIESNILDISPVPGQIQHADFLWISQIVGNDDYYFITVRNGFPYDTDDNYSLLLHNIKDRTTSHISTLRNDLDFGMPFWPQWFLDGYFVGFYHAHEILHYVNSTEHKVVGDDLLQLAEELNENDNPVLVFVK